MNQVQQLEPNVHYYRIKEYDFNDVFDYETIVKCSEDKIEQFVLSHFKSRIRSKLQDYSDDITISYCYLKTFGRGRFAELLNAYGVDAELIENEDLEYYLNEKRFNIVDLTN